MKKNRWILLLFILLGLLGGTLAARGLDHIESLSVLTRPMPVSWSPAADLSVIRYDLTLEIDLTLLSIAGAAAAIWLYRKM